MKSFHNRIKFIIIAGVCLSFLLIGRILQLQYFTEEYKAMAIDQRTSVRELKPQRGSILDREGGTLAESVKETALYLYPYQVSQEDRLVEFLKTSLGIKEKKILGFLAQEDKVLVKDKLTSQDIEKLNQANLDGLRLETSTTRVYPNGKFFSQGLGFLNEDLHGEYGLEAYYDHILYGQEGMNVKDMSPIGEAIPYQRPNHKKALRGGDIRLTIDSQIQKIVEEKGMESYEEFKPKNLSVIVMDPRNGDILAMENFPNYDPNEPRKSVENELKNKKLSEDKLLEEILRRWKNFGVQDAYEPGSIYKVITAASGVEKGTISPSTTFECKGLVEDIAGMTLYCHVYPESHGIQDLNQAMANSCNPAFIKMAQDLGKEGMFNFLKGFGFNQPTGIDLPGEAVGLVPQKLEDITDSQLATMGYGHGISVTPIQVIRAISAAVNGGDLYQPRLADEIIRDGKAEKIERPDPIKLVKEETSSKIKEALVYGVDHGTADGARIMGYDIGGKTGTSEKIVDGEYSADVSVASFVGVYPAYDPEYVILAVADEAQGATSGNIVTAPIVKGIIEELIKIRKDEPTRLDEFDGTYLWDPVTDEDSEELDQAEDMNSEPNEEYPDENQDWEPDPTWQNDQEIESYDYDEDEYEDWSPDYDYHDPNYDEDYYEEDYNEPEPDQALG